MNRIFRSRTDKVLGGVCAGIGHQLCIDPTLVRLFFVVFALADGLGVFLYLLLWVVLPLEPAEVPEADSAGEAREELADKARTMRSEMQNLAQERDPRVMTWIGASLVLLGALVFLRRLDIPWLAWLDFDYLWPLLLILGGLVVILRRGGSDERA